MTFHYTYFCFLKVHTFDKKNMLNVLSTYVQCTHAKCFYTRSTGISLESWHYLFKESTGASIITTWLVGKLRIRGVKNVLEATSQGSKEPHLELEHVPLSIRSTAC